MYLSHATKQGNILKQNRVMNVQTDAVVAIRVIFFRANILKTHIFTSLWAFIAQPFTLSLPVIVTPCMDSPIRKTKFLAQLDNL